MGCCVTCHSYIHTHGEQTIANNFTGETDFIKKLESELWEKRNTNRASDFPTNWVKVPSKGGGAFVSHAPLSYATGLIGINDACIYDRSFKRD